MMMADMTDPSHSPSYGSPIVQVLFDFEHVTKDGRLTSMHRGEQLALINKTNSDWWLVKRLESKDGCGKSFSHDDGNEDQSLCHQQNISGENNNMNKTKNGCEDEEEEEERDRLDSSSGGEAELEDSEEYDLFYAPVSYLSEIKMSQTKTQANNNNNMSSSKKLKPKPKPKCLPHGVGVITTSRNHKTTIKVGNYDRAGQAANSHSNSLSDDDRLNDSYYSSRESLIELDHHSEAHGLDDDDDDDYPVSNTFNTTNCDKPTHPFRLSKSKSSIMNPPSPPAYENLSFFSKFNNHLHGDHDDSLNRSLHSKSTTRRSPIAPIPGTSPVRILLNHWAEYEDADGRKYYYNSLTRECSWKPPRRKAFHCRLLEADEDQDTATSHSEGNLTDSSSIAELPVTTLSNRNHNSKNTHANFLSTSPSNTFNSSSSSPTNPNPNTSPSTNKPKSRLRKLVKHHKVSLNAIAKNNSNNSNASAAPSNSTTTNNSKNNGNNSNTSQCESIPQLPKGWTRKYNAETRELYFVNEKRNEKWFCKLDENGRLYFFEQNGQESYWELPEYNSSDDQHLGSDETPKSHQNEHDHVSPSSNATMEDSGIAISGASNDSLSGNNNLSTANAGTPGKGRQVANKLSPSQKLFFERNLKSRSMAFLPGSTSCTVPKIPAILLQDDNHSFNSEQSGMSMPVFSPPPTCLDESVKTLKQGVLNKTKLVEGGKRIRKNWTSTYFALTDLYLLFFKDAKTAQSGGKPEMIIDLAGAMITWSREKSSRKNCFQLSTISGQQVLLQEDDPIVCKEWFDLISNSILKLPSAYNYDESEKEPLKLKRSKSTKQYRRREDNNESEGFYPLMTSQSATTANLPPDKRNKIKERLIKFLRRRPTIETLREKGIFQDEPVFGGKLEHLCLRDKQYVPKFVQQCVKAIEFKDLLADGLYRACGNLSQVQKLRFQINQDNFSGLWSEDDVHVLTGLLKMFFRDMKEPLFPCDRFDALMKIIVLPDRKSKLDALTKMIRELPRPHYETLKFLLQHLLRVKQHSDENRMHIQNLAIVFGPTLMWPENDSNNFALDMMLRMHQNQIIEFLLLEFDNMFR